MEIRREWLSHGLSTRPADRATVEITLTRLYARVSRPRPRFVWVDSPRQALPLVRGLPTLDDLHDWVMAERPAATAPLAGDIAASVSRLRGALDAARPAPEQPHRKVRLKKEDWTTWPPLQALTAGVALDDVLRHGVWEALSTSLANGFHHPVRAALLAGLPPATTGRQLPVAWYGQQDSSWIAYYDALRRLGLAAYSTGAEEHLDDWAALARAGGWWWPGEQTCVVVERPTTVDTAPVPGARHDEIRPLHIGYGDSWYPIGEPIAPAKAA